MKKQTKSSKAASTSSKKTVRKTAKPNPAATKKKTAVKKAPLRPKIAQLKPGFKGAAAEKASVKKSVGVERPVTKAPVSVRKASASSLAVMASGEFAIGTTTVEKESSKKGWFRRFFGVTRRKPRLLWIGDALVPTGFATVTHAVLNHLRHDWDVVVSGVNYDGSEHKLPYPVMPAWQGGDMWGMNRFAHLCA